MARFAENRRLYGSNSRVTRSSKGIASPVQVLDMLMDKGHGVVINNRKSDMREPVGRIIPRKLVPVTASMTAEEQAMYIQLCKLAGC